MEKIARNPKILVFTILAVLIVGLVVAYFLISGRNDSTKPVTSELVVTSTPSEVNLKIDGQDYGKVVSGQKVDVNATGKVTLIASRKGFSEVQVPAVLSSEKPNGVTVELEPQTKEAKAVVADDLDLKEQDKVTGEFLEDTEEAYKKYPILSDMPYTGNRFELYQGISKDKEHEFGVYLYLFKGAEEQGRAAFKAWMESHGYDPKEYNVVEEVKPAKQSAGLPEIPTGDALEALTVDSIKVEAKPEQKKRNADQLAQYFGLFTASWEPKKDGYIEASELKAKPLMAKKLADTVKVPYRPTITFNWQGAQADNGKSFPWIQTYKSTTKGKETKATMQVCWAWVSDEKELTYDAPRNLEVTVKDGKVQAYKYTDGDPFVDHSNTICDPDNR